MGRQADSAASPTAPDSSMKAKPQSTGCPFTRTIIPLAGHYPPPQLTTIQLIHNYPFSGLSAGSEQVEFNVSLSLCSH